MPETPHSLKALTVCQPWAWALIEGGKDFEYRSWPTRHRGPLLIHAGKGRGWLGTEKVPSSFQCVAWPPYSELVFGAIVGMVTVVDCIEDDGFYWLVADPVSFDEPVLWKGARGLFNIRTDVVAGQLRAAAQHYAVSHPDAIPSSLRPYVPAPTEPS